MSETALINSIVFSSITIVHISLMTSYSNHLHFIYTDRNRNHVNHQPPDQNEDKTTEPPALTYVTKNQFEYFQPRVEIETEDEGNKTYLKEIYIKGNCIWNGFYLFNLSAKKINYMLEIRLYLSNLKTYETVVYLSMKYKD